MSAGQPVQQVDPYSCKCGCITRKLCLLDSGLHSASMEAGRLALLQCTCLHVIIRRRQVGQQRLQACVPRLQRQEKTTLA